MGKKKKFSIAKTKLILSKISFKKLDKEGCFVIDEDWLDITPRNAMSPTKLREIMTRHVIERLAGWNSMGKAEAFTKTPEFETEIQRLVKEAKGAKKPPRKRLNQIRREYITRKVYGFHSANINLKFSPQESLRLIQDAVDELKVRVTLEG